MNVLYVYADSPMEWNCSEWNCVIQAKAINRTGKHTANLIYINDFVTNTPEAQKLGSEADVIVVERNYFGDTLSIITYWKVRNKTVLGIFDDAYDIMHPMNMSYRFWTYGEMTGRNQTGDAIKVTMIPHPLEQFKWGCGMVKGIQVPSVMLAKDWGKYGNTQYIHNYLDLEKYLNVKPLLPHASNEIYIGWCGSMSHHSSFTDSGVLDALKKIARRNPNVTVLIGGDQRIFELLEVEKKIFQGYVPNDQWTSLIKSMDIGLAPLSGEYDKRRSWIKVLEYMGLKVPWIATDYITYNELRDYGMLIENGSKNWESSIQKMIDEYSKYKELADGKAYNFAVSMSSDNNIQRVTLPWYEKMMNTPYSK